MAGMIQVLRQIVAPGDSCPRDAFLSKQHASPLLDSIAVSHTVPMHDPSTQYQDQYGDETHLLSSPYTDQQHLLDVTTLDHTEHIELAKALQHLVRVRDDYATAEYATSFNWPEVVDQLRASLDASAQTFKRTKFYVIVFRSRLPLDTDRAHLGRLDAASHLEATQSGGLLKYWFGIPDSKGANLATCIWRYRQDARKGGAGPGHRKSMQAVQEIYLDWHVERLALVIEDDVSTWKIEQWNDDDEPIAASQKLS